MNSFKNYKKNIGFGLSVLMLISASSPAFAVARGFSFFAKNEPVKTSSCAVKAAAIASTAGKFACKGTKLAGNAAWIGTKFVGNAALTGTKFVAKKTIDLSKFTIKNFYQGSIRTAGGICVVGSVFGCIGLLLYIADQLSPKRSGGKPFYVEIIGNLGELFNKGSTTSYNSKNNSSKSQKSILTDENNNASVRQNTNTYANGSF